jgi:uncharacterized protein DUF3332
MKTQRLTHSARRVIAVTLAASSLAASTGCFGSFITTQRLYHWNETVDANKWAKWGVFVVTVIMPIYPSATLFDMIFTNSVEFWSGRNPMAAAGETQTYSSDNGDSVSMRRRADGAIDVSIQSPSGAERKLVLVPGQASDSIAAYDENGQLVARALPAEPASH